MKIVLFYHSFVSCWNHGNAHFLRGVTRELINLGHEVHVYEPEDGWSRSNALADGGAAALSEAAHLVPGATLRTYHEGELDLHCVTDGADLVIVHEWNTPSLIDAIGRHRISGAACTLLFHDTHHRAVTAPSEVDALELEGYDGVLVFGEALREIYVEQGWTRRAFTWHEAADTALFRPLNAEQKDADVIWIGNWGDDERTRELETFLLNPVTRLAQRTRVHGVRYPADVRRRLAARGIVFGGWLANHRVPDAFARARATVHVPRRPYTEALPGIPTIRVFEALACGVPLVCAPWCDDESLFPAGAYLTGRDQDEMTAALSLVLHDSDAARQLAQTGLRAIRERHSCAHRVQELLAIVRTLRPEKIKGRSRAALVENRAVVS
jgi:spore maturation protein CgeB